MRATAVVAILLLHALCGRAAAQHGAHLPVPAEVKPAASGVGGTAGEAVLRDLSSAPDIVEVQLRAGPARRSLLPEIETDVYAYNGRIPGPLLEVSEGDSVIIHFHNDLPEETTVHWHGLHVPFTSDGSPFHPIGPGERFTYAFRIRREAAGTYWYHPHPHHRTAYQVGKGLYGAIIVRDPDDPLPASLTEHLLVLSDNRFGEDGSIDFPDPDSPQGRIDEMNGREGDVLFVNDEIKPTISIRSGEVQRWRIINASGARIYRLALEDHTFLHVGSDGGLFEHAMELDEIVLANGERAELLVRGTSSPGSRHLLRTLPYNRYMARTRPADWKQPKDVLAVQYTDEPPVETIDLPQRLREVPAIDPEESSGSRTVLLSQGRINGEVMDIGRVDAEAAQGSVEIWQIDNLVGMDHPFHLHGLQFQVLDRNGVPERQPMWKDTVNLPKFESARIIVRFDNHPGKWMFHCHILDHEDQGMMGVLEVK